MAKCWDLCVDVHVDYNVHVVYTCILQSVLMGQLHVIFAVSTFCAGFIVRWLPRLKGKLQGSLFDDEEYWDVSEGGREEGCEGGRGRWRRREECEGGGRDGREGRDVSEGGGMEEKGGM